ncbi:alpha/beta hydrolase, partial [Luedemannella flava]|uniref:alpha/beta hydrolase n=1 Tax=Luedemannella flava TaxID=349316 RepID=UPI0031DB3DC4
GAAARQREDAVRGTGGLALARRLGAIEARLSGLGAIAARLADGGRAPAYLLDLDVSGDGRAVVAVGDPDHATDVLTYVPGVNPGIAGVGNLLDRTDDLRDAAERLDGPADRHAVSAITWLGYDSPEWAAVASAGTAHGAEPALDSFLDGLRATHEGAPAHQTVLGHSYGSLVIGVTARDAGLDADDVIFVGSAGVGVPDVGDLRLPAGHVWSSTVADDPVAHFAPGFGQFARDLGHNLTAPFSRTYGDTVPDVELWHGRNPSDPGFGANVFVSDPGGGHSGYFGGSGLDNIARITLGGEHLADVK